MMVTTGFCGSHRTGKTTLARQVAEMLGLPFVETSTSAVFAANGLSPSEPMDFNTRLWIQDKVVAAAEEVWRAEDGAFITDRTPIDMMAYTLADINGAVRVDYAVLESYLDHCFQVTCDIFSELILLQPAIPLVHEEGKAALNRAYIEHLNILMTGLGNDQRQSCPFRVVPRGVIAMPARLTLMRQWLESDIA